VSLIRCATCRYSFEHVADEPPTGCPQCGGALEDREAPQAGDERKKTQKLKIIPKPD
jgi:rRNA maturation endonuclease Nob1